MTWRKQTTVTQTINERPHEKERTGNVTETTDDRSRLLKRGLTESPSSKPAVYVDTDTGSRLMGAAQAMGDQVKGCETSSIKAKTDGLRFNHVTRYSIYAVARKNAVTCTVYNNPITHTQDYLTLI